MLVWLNGQFVDRDQASVSIFDAGFQHGVGLFETMLARHGAVFRIEAHLDRLANSAQELLLTKRLRIDPLADAVELTLKKNNLTEARVRVTITGGNLNLLEQKGQAGVEPTIAIVVQPPTVYPQEFFERGVLVVIADGRENPLHPMAGHKTLNYWPRIRALQEAAAKRAGEAIWFTVSNHLSSGCVSNIFLVKDGQLFTPIAHREEEPGALPAPVLPGITRSAIIEFAETMEIQTTRKMLDINDVLSADEVFLTNSSWGVLPVSGVEQHQIGTGEVGEITRRLRKGWLHLVQQETQSAGM